jgi:hypothetical protein
MSEQYPNLRKGFELEHLTGLSAHERDDMVALVTLGLTPAEVRKDWKLYCEVVLFSTQSSVDWDFKISGARQARRYVAMRRKGTSPGQAMHLLEHGTGCMLLILAAGLSAGAGLALLVFP